jgi:hypothetical protein
MLFTSPSRRQVFFQWNLKWIFLLCFFGCFDRNDVFDLRCVCLKSIAVHIEQFELVVCPQYRLVIPIST